MLVLISDLFIYYFNNEVTGHHSQWCWEKSSVHPFCFTVGLTALTVLCEWFSLTLLTVYTSINLALKPVLQQRPQSRLTCNKALLLKSPHNHTRPGQQILSPEKATQWPCRARASYTLLMERWSREKKARPVRTKPAGWAGSMLWSRKLHWLPGILTTLCFQQLHQTNILTRTWQLSTLPFHLASLFPSKHITQAMWCSIPRHNARYHFLHHFETGHTMQLQLVWN